MWCCLFCLSSNFFLLGPNSSLPGTSDHLLIQHMPKTGGTSFREMIIREAKRRGKTVQTHYGVIVKSSPIFDKEHPAQVIIGHHVNFYLLQPVATGRTVRYVTMVRSPLSWVLSLYLQFHTNVEKDLDKKLIVFVKDLFKTCKGLVRGSNGTECAGQLYSWHSGGAPATPNLCESSVSFPPKQCKNVVSFFPPDKCERFVSFFTHPSHLLLVNERYEESIWLLYQMLGWGSPPELVHSNARADRFYQQKITLRTTSYIATTLTGSCLPDIYAASRRRFNHIYRLAHTYCSKNKPCHLAISEFGRQLWTPLTGE
mmetsp:Transcript_74/g.149  ORF Transcript_74/g.149 Transcript_74/m.149 type:complete len:313 (+) Transcript_74:156-1094(+)